ncbi:hypothetical protein HH1059_23230 [Halorhodospira halochloris]|uniref:Uncharacterized protein n=1 Tax=Halorhodospira halochloris TaxID=1052 RepID=A0A2Z6EZX5_HALHR|nr:hypothetical protein [Halorhodospira halochloris]BBE11171.1 hypothetical protein HH1059_23230 [Halorhodospira halochloris]
MNPSLEASWLHPWRQVLHTGADGGAGEVLEAPLAPSSVTSLAKANLSAFCRFPWLAKTFKLA